jgi:hypothetical protein
VQGILETPSMARISSEYSPNLLDLILFKGILLPLKVSISL